jgi:hypothetical protein
VASAAASGICRGDAVVLQVDRDGELMFLGFELD